MLSCRNLSPVKRSEGWRPRSAGDHLVRPLSWISPTFIMRVTATDQPDSAKCLKALHDRCGQTVEQGVFDRCFQPAPRVRGSVSQRTSCRAVRRSGWAGRGRGPETSSTTCCRQPSCRGRFCPEAGGISGSSDTLAGAVFIRRLAGHLWDGASLHGYRPGSSFRLVLRWLPASTKARTGRNSGAPWPALVRPLPPVPLRSEARNSLPAAILVCVRG